MPDEVKPDEFGWLRVTDKDSGHKYSIRESQLPHGNYTVLKAAASDANGEPLPPEHNAVKPTVTSGQQATTEKES